MRLTPQLGLVPLGENEQGYWEFWHVASGGRPVWTPKGARCGEGDGVILVLLPGGTYRMGWREPDDPDHRNEPLHEVTVPPFFLMNLNDSVVFLGTLTGRNHSG